MYSQRKEVHENQLVFNITYYPISSKLKNILSKIHPLITPDRGHCKVLENILIIGFEKGKSLKDILVRAKVPPLKTIRVSVVRAIKQDVKFVNILTKHICLNQHLGSTCIASDHIV